MYRSIELSSCLLTYNIRIYARRQRERENEREKEKDGAHRINYPAIPETDASAPGPARSARFRPGRFFFSRDRTETEGYQCNISAQNPDA